MLTKLKHHALRLRPYTQTALLPAMLIYTLGAFGAVCMGSTTVYLIEQAVCREHFSSVNSTVIGPGGLMDEEMCKVPEVQGRLASVHGILKALLFMPALFLTGPYGKIAEVLGKRTILFLNMCSSTLGQLYFTGVCYFQLPITLLYVMPFFDIIGGGGVIFSSFIYGYIAESVDPKDLSGILYKMSAIQLILAFGGMSLSSWLLRGHVWVLCIMGIICFSFTIPSTLLFPRTTKPISPINHYVPPPFADEVAETAAALQASAISAEIAATRESAEQHDISETTSLLSNSNSSSVTKVDTAFLSPALEAKEKESAISTIFHALTTQYIHSLSIFKDIYNSSPLARTTLLTYFLLMAGMEIRVIFIQWASVTFGWIIADVNALTSYEMIVSGSILLTLPYLSRKFLYPNLGNESSRVDMFIAKVSIAAHAIGLLGMGFAPNKTAYIASVTVWTSGIGWNDSLRSFATGILSGKEGLDQLYLGIGLVETCAGMVGAVAWSAAYARVVGSGWVAKRSLFVVGSAIICASLVCTFVMGRFGRRKVQSAAL